MIIEVTTGPTAEPLHLDEATLHIKQDSDADDTLIGNLIRAAREYVQDLSGRALVAQTRRLTLDAWPRNDIIILPYPPLVSVSSITYVDTAGTTQTRSSTLYDVDARSQPGRVMPAFSEVWPTTRAVLNAVDVTYVCGYATPFTVNTSTDVLTCSGRAYSDNDIVRLSNSGGALPTGLAANTDYYVISASGSTMKLSTSEGGSAVDITDAGTGTHFVGEVPKHLLQAMLMIIAHWYEHREAWAERAVAEIPLGAKALIWQDSARWL